MSDFSKNIALSVVFVLIAIAVFETATMSPPAPETKLPYSAFVEDVAKGQIHDITIQGGNLTGTLVNGQKFSSYAPNDAGLADRLIAKGIQVNIVPPSDSLPSLFGILISWFPMLLLIGVWILSCASRRAGAIGLRDSAKATPGSTTPRGTM